MVVEALPDGRELVEHADGRVEVRGTSTRPTERARMGYVAVTRRAAGRPAAPSEPERRARALLEDLLDETQRRDLARRGRWWVATPRGPVELGGSPHAMRHLPHAHPGEVWELCAVPTDLSLPRSDVWTNLLLTLSVDPERFFAVANVHRRRRASGA